MFLGTRRFTGTIFGAACVLGASFELASGHHRQAVIGFALGIGIIAIWEWVVWRGKPYAACFWLILQRGRCGTPTFGLHALLQLGRRDTLATQR